MVPGIGGILARNLVSYLGSVKQIFTTPQNRLMKIPGIGEGLAQRICESGYLEAAHREIDFIEKNNVRVYFYLDDNYPLRFRQCADAPILFYMKGNADLESQKIISIVGTRKATDYGRQVCDELIRDIAEVGHEVLIVSGMAYGIDIQAHKSALKYGMPTVGVLGHGLDVLYPRSHINTAHAMVTQGGLLSDFPSQSIIDRGNFVRRNRLIAGLSDATIVIESGAKGGALITAEIAASYDRDVYAFPGRSVDPYSKGCNFLIKNNVAALIENAGDLMLMLGWNQPGRQRQPVQQLLFEDLSEEEQLITGQLHRNGKVFIDTLKHSTRLPMNRLSGLLLTLEFKGILEALPGKMYRLK